MSFSEYDSYPELGTACFRQTGEVHHKQNKSAIIGRYYLGKAKGDELSFEFSTATTEDLSSINNKYNSLNENVKKFLQLKASLRVKEQNILSMERKLVNKRNYLKKMADKWKVLCKEPVKYEAKKKEIGEFVEELKEKERNVKNMKRQLKELKHEYNKKEEKLREEEEEYKRQKDKYEAECNAKDKEYQNYINELKNKTLEYEMLNKINEEKMNSIAQKKLQVEQAEKVLEEKKIELQKKAEEIIELGKGYKTSEESVIGNFSKIKAKHLATLGKKKELLVKEQELKIGEIKLAQQRKELEAKTNQLEELEKNLGRLAMSLDKREKTVNEVEKSLEEDVRVAQKEYKELKKKEEELKEREAKLTEKANLDEELEIKLLDIEMSAHALKKRQELNTRTVESEMQKLKEKEANLKRREQDLIKNGVVSSKYKDANKENVYANKVLEDALFN